MADSRLDGNSEDTVLNDTSSNLFNRDNTHWDGEDAEDTKDDDREDRDGKYKVSKGKGHTLCTGNMIVAGKRGEKHWIYVGPDCRFC